MIVKQHRNAMQTLVELLPEIERMGNREAVRWSNGFRTWIATYRELYGKIGAVVNDFDRRRESSGMDGGVLGLGGARHSSSSGGLSILARPCAAYFQGIATQARHRQRRA